MKNHFHAKEGKTIFRIFENFDSPMGIPTGDMPCTKSIRNQVNID